jgi:hypothetical protein
VRAPRLPIGKCEVILALTLTHAEDLPEHANVAGWSDRKQLKDEDPGRLAGPETSQFRMDLQRSPSRQDLDAELHNSQAQESVDNLIE